MSHAYLPDAELRKAPTPWLPCAASRTPKPNAIQNNLHGLIVESARGELHLNLVRDNVALGAAVDVADRHHGEIEAAAIAHANSSDNIVLVPPTDLPASARQTGEGMFLHDTVEAGHCSISNRVRAPGWPDLM
jgi:hypothetical protein